METIVEQNKDRKIANNVPNIKGWGIDADPENDPTYPMKKWNGADHQRLNYEKAPQQPLTVDLLMSIERPTITRVFGTSTPPSGLSGAIRKFAFKYSEADARRWLSLILADRVNAWEGIIDDLAHGHIPNIIAERGWTAEWKYNRKSFVQKLAIGAAVAGVGIALLYQRSKSSSNKKWIEVVK